MYFTSCKTAEELKKAYRQIVKKLHPDNGGEASLFKEMQAEFSAAWERLKNIHVNKNGEQYTKETTETAQEFMDIIEKVIHLDGVEVELCGSWIWCSGNTRTHKAALSAAGFHWSKPKAAWYFHFEPYRKHYRGGSMSLDEIRNFYGSQKFHKGNAKKNDANTEEEQLNALPA